MRKEATFCLEATWIKKIYIIGDAKENILNINEVLKFDCGSKF